MHWHSEFEINFVREGFAEFNCGDEKFVSSAGDIIVIQPNVMHSVYPCPDAHQVYDTLVFSHEIFGRSETDRYINECIKPLMNGSMRIPMHITAAHHYYHELEMMMENIFACAKGDAPQLDMLMRSELLRFFWLLETESEVDADFHEPSEVIRPALEYISIHFPGEHHDTPACGGGASERKLLYEPVSEICGIQRHRIHFPLPHQPGVQASDQHKRERPGNCFRLRIPEYLQLQPAVPQSRRMFTHGVPPEDEKCRIKSTVSKKAYHIHWYAFCMVYCVESLLQSVTLPEKSAYSTDRYQSPPAPQMLSAILPLLLGVSRISLLPFFSRICTNPA